MKRTLVFLLAMVMLFSVAPMAALAEATAEPISVVMLDPYYGDASSEAGYKMVQDAILAGTGVLVTSYRFDSTSKAEKVNLLLASKDVKVNTWCENWTEYLGFGMIQPITKYMDLIPNTIEAWNAYNAWVCMTDKDGEIWGIPRVTDRAFNQTFLRQDWLDQLGLEAPTTFEDFEKCLYAIQAADPYGNGETITMITRNNMTYLEYHFLAGFTTYGRSNWMDEDGLLKPYYLQEGYYDFLAKMHKWYEDGIIHVENPTWNTATVRNYIASGRVATSGAYTTDLSAQHVNLKKNNPNASWYYPVDGLIGPNGNKAETLMIANDEAQLFNVKNTEEEMKACLKVFEWGYSDWRNAKTMNSGIEGIHWDFDMNYPNAVEDHTTIEYEVDPSIDYAGDFWYTIGMAYEGDCIYYDADGQQNYHNVMLRHQKDFYTCTAPFDAGVVYNTTELYDNVMEASDIETMVSREIMAFFTGDRELTPENWQGFIDELYNAGLQGYMEEYTRQYKDWKGIE